KAQNKDEAARLVEMEFKPAWKNADVELNIDELELGSPRTSTRAANSIGYTRLRASLPLL
ncbi:MAG TPA: hypothetical protein VJR04_03920, partial [Terriglobales bacterium]|nr:hypothetical protein [Terriglobales bacterium]